MNTRCTRREALSVAAFIFLFFAVNLLFLTRFPFVHSDESWLAGLTRNMLEHRSLGVTEAFFNLKLRYPHAIKSLFHLLQMPFLALFGYGVFPVRLLSLLGGCGALALFYLCARLLAQKHLPALAATAVLACDVQFIAASHLARQEILLCCAMLACVLLFLRRDDALTAKTAAALAVITGISVGLHPNSFLVATLCGCVLLVRCLVFHSAAPRLLALYAAVTGAIAALFAAASFAMDPQFPAHYLAYGESEFNLAVPVTQKLGELGYYFQKLWHGVSGTYYVPNLKPQLILFPLLLAAALWLACALRKTHCAQSQRLFTPVAAAAGVLLGTVLIGRYNQTGFVFLVPLCWLTLAPLCARLGKRAGRGAFAAAAAVTTVACVLCISPWLGKSYERYLGQLSALVPRESKVIANLNSEFYFENGALLDYRNLSFLRENNLSFAEYVRENGVEYLVLSDELDYIYSIRPKWNMIYGNLNYMEELRAFTQTSCTVVGSFTNNTYGARIREQMDAGREWFVTVYRVLR